MSAPVRSRGTRGKSGRTPRSGDLLLETADQDPWLISYADMMTLLVGLFVMMFSFASFDQSSISRMSKALAGAFGESEQAKVEKLSHEISQAMAMTPYYRDMEISSIEGGLQVSFTTTALFASGQAELDPAAERAMRALAGRIRAFGGDARIRVEGYTDDNPVLDARHSSNWELSGARAAAIVQILQSLRFDPDRLETVGYGASRPLLPNRDVAGRPLPDNQAKNRRVVLKVLLR